MVDQNYQDEQKTLQKKYPGRANYLNIMVKRNKWVKQKEIGRTKPFALSKIHFGGIRNGTGAKMGGKVDNELGNKLGNIGSMSKK